LRVAVRSLGPAPPRISYIFQVRVHSLVYVYADRSMYSEQFSSIVSQFFLLFLTFFFLIDGT
jgi:hypothetical protein